MGIILVSNDEVKLMVNTVDNRPTSENEFIQLSSPDINDSGTVVFYAMSAPDATSTFKQKVYKFDEGELTPIVSPGDLVNGLDATIMFVNSSDRLSLNNNGEVAFNATLSDDSKGIFLFTEEGIQPVLLEGDQFPVFNGKETLVFAILPIINDKREIVVLARFVKDGGDPNNSNDYSSGVFLVREGEIIHVKLPEEEAPGTNGMVFFREHMSWISLGNNSEVVFRGEYMVPGGDSNNMEDRRGSGVFLWSEGDTQPLALTEDRIDGVRGSVLGNPGTLVKNSINDSGEIAASLAMTHTGGIFLFSNDNIVPAVLAKEIRQKLDTLIFTSTAAINNKGNIVFFGTDILGREGVFQAIKQ